MRKLTVHISLMIGLSLSLFSCQNTLDGLTEKTSASRTQSLTIQKSEGVNVNEADAIWISAMKPHDPASDTRVVKIHRLSLNLERNYPVTSFDLVLQGLAGRAGSGIRTYVIPDGFLMGKTSEGIVSLFLATKDKKVTQIFQEGGHYPPGRATPFSYRVKKNGQTYEFIAISYREAGDPAVFRVARFLKNGNSYQQVRTYRFPFATQYPHGVYTGALDPCSKKQASGDCAPRFFGGRVDEFFGIDLTQDVPPSPYQAGQYANITAFRADNEGWTSTSHAPGGGYGTVNRAVYSMAIDEFGNLLRAHYPDTSSGNNFLSYDKVNQLAFHAHRATRLEPDGSLGTNNRSLLTVYKRECFSAEPNCDPTATTNVRARLFRDVGEQLGPTSDLGNGCVAVLSFKRPQEEGGNTWFTKVYKACIRDSADLDRGLTVSLLGSVEGAAYMYNDFTGATLFDRPVYLLFDFDEKGYPSIKNVKYHWAPRVGFSSSPVGLLAYYRCYAKNARPTGDAGFQSFILGKGIEQHDLPGCGGSGISQVEFKLERDPASSVRFTRFQNFNVTASQ